MTITLTEFCGVDWRCQWLLLETPPALGRLVDRATLHEIPFQNMADGRALCRVDLMADATLNLDWQPEPPAPVAGAVTAESKHGEITIANGHVTVRLAETFTGGATVRGPLLGIRRQAESGWLAPSRFIGDVRAGTARIAEAGPLRASYEAVLSLECGGEYRFRLELLDGEEWVRIQEWFNAGIATTGTINRLAIDLAGFQARRLVIDGWPGTIARLHEARDYHAPFGVDKTALAALGAQTIFGQVGVPWALLDDGTTALGAVAANGGDWRYPADATLRLRRIDGNLELSGEAVQGSREWLMVCGDAAHWMPEAGEPATAAAHLKARGGDLSLEKTRDWTLDISDEAMEPLLWTDRAGLEAARARLREPPWSGLIGGIPRISLETRSHDESVSACFGLCGTTDSFPSGIHWLQRNDEPSGAELATQIRDWAKDAARRFAAGGLLAAKTDVVALRTLKHCLYWYDLLRGSNLMSGDDAAQTRRAVLFCAYCMFERNYFDWESACAPPDSEHSLRRFLLEEDYSDTMGCQNFHSDIFSYLGAVGLVFPGHPMARAWIDHAETMAIENLECFIAPDGAYVESDNYFQHFLGLIYYLGYALHRAGRPAILDHPRMKAGLEYWVRSQTPPLLHTGSPATAWFGVYTENPRHRPIVQMPPLGDCGLNWGAQAMPSFLHHAANFYASREPELAGWLEWTWRRAGRPLAQYNFVIQELATQELSGPPPLEYSLRSGELQGHGILMRAGIGTQRETALLVSCGRATSHMHFDAGSLLLWHAGVPVIVDPGYIHDEFTAERQLGCPSWKHSTITFGYGDGAWMSGDLGMEHRPPPRSVLLSDEFDYVECDLSHNNARGSESWRAMRRIVSVEHYRQVLFAKNRYVVIRDRIFRSIYPATWHLWLFGENETNDNGQVRCHGRFGVDLIVTFVQPQRPVVHAENYSAARHIWTRQPPERDFLVVLQPALSHEEPYSVEPRADGASISGPGWVDEVWMDSLPGQGSASQWHRSQMRHAPCDTEEPLARCRVVRDGVVRTILK